MTFTTETMLEIMTRCSEALKQEKCGISFEVLDPDLGRGRYAGEMLEVGGMLYRYHGYRSWNDLAELLGCRMLTPQKSGDVSVTIRFEKLDTDESFHRTEEADKKEKYGTESRFAAIDKSEEPAFLHAYAQALRNVNVSRRVRILDLGVNNGDEFELIRRMLSAEEFGALELHGIDHSESAIAEARGRFGTSNVHFYTHDINDLVSLGLGRFDLIISVGTLQSPGIDYKPFLMALVQEHLDKHGALILGFPNCRWVDGEMIYGAKAPNYRFSEQSLLYNDVMFAKKYLQQKKFRVTLTGKQYLFLTATSIR